MESRYHEPVLLDETIEYLLGNKEESLSKLYVDCTLGGGGYTRKILEHTADDFKVAAIDRDANAIEHCLHELKGFEGRVIYSRSNFADIAETLEELNIKQISGIVMDLGLSSYQLNNEEGFSYQRDTKLDMRADKQQHLTAGDVINGYSEEALLGIFKNYGELKYTKQITRDIAEARKVKKIETTFELVEILKQKIPPRFLNKDLSKVFQAIRIEVNGELENLKRVLESSAGLLETGGRIVAVSYHSLEDRIVKNVLRSTPELRVLTKKPVEAGEAETERNTRARSARLRAAEKK